MRNRDAILALTAPKKIIQPSHLPAQDPSLANEILPAPPPLSILLNPNSSQHRKLANILSYLPMNDPGSSYVNTLSHSLTNGGPINDGADGENGRKRKPTRGEKPPQRIAAQPETTSNTTPPIQSIDNQQISLEPLSSARPSRLNTPDVQPMSLPAPPNPAPSKKSLRKLKVVPNYAPVATVDGRPLSQLALASTSLTELVGDVPISFDRTARIKTGSNNAISNGPADGGLAGRGTGQGNSSARGDLQTGTPAEPRQVAQAPNSDVCSACINTTLTHPSMLSLCISAQDQGGGALLYCDGCPRSFHLLCLNPPIDPLEPGAVPEGGWFCRECQADAMVDSVDILMPQPVDDIKKDYFSSMIFKLRRSNPVEFQLPEDIRSHFKNVITGPRGGYIDGRRFKLAKGNKQIVYEDRDPFRTRDRYNRPVLCHKCGGSAVRSSISGGDGLADIEMHGSQCEEHAQTPDMQDAQLAPVKQENVDMMDLLATTALQGSSGSPPPLSDTTSVRAGIKRKRETSPIPNEGVNNTDSGPRTRRRTDVQPPDAHSAFSRGIISCDYCPLHWHMDCLSPPMSVLPGREKKWMCPNHIEHLFSTKPRLPKHGQVIVEVSKPGHRNSGLIDIVHQDPLPFPPLPPKPVKRLRSTINPGNIDELWVGAKKYRVPERVVMLDFWKKVSKEKKRMARLNGNDEANTEPLSDTSSLTELSSSEEEVVKPVLPSRIVTTEATISTKPKAKLHKPSTKPRSSNGVPRPSRVSRPSQDVILPLKPRASIIIPPDPAISRKTTLNIPPTPTLTNAAPEEVVPEISQPPPITLEPSAIIESPKSKATLNSKGGLTLRIPKPGNSPAGPSKIPEPILASQIPAQPIFSGPNDAIATSSEGELLTNSTPASPLSIVDVEGLTTLNNIPPPQPAPRARGWALANYRGRGRGRNKPHPRSILNLRNQKPPVPLPPPPPPPPPPTEPAMLNQANLVDTSMSDGGMVSFAHIFEQNGHVLEDTKMLTEEPNVMTTETMNTSATELEAPVPPPPPFMFPSI